MRADQIAVQLYTLRDLLEEDVPGTLRAVVDAGYRAVEIAGMPPMSAELLRDTLSEVGLVPIAAHVSLDDLRADRVGVFERAQNIGYPRVIVPWLPEAQRSSVDGVVRLAEELGAIAGACADAGLTLGYHNHDFEFAELEGTTIWDVLLETLPDAVDLELDVYWATLAGEDPAAVIRSAGGRIRLLHMKDMAAGAAGDVAPGDGVLDWPGIIAAGRSIGTEWYVVEKDDTTNALADVARGLRYLRGLAAREV